MSDLSVFAFDTRAVRVVMVDGEPWFVGKDVAEVLGYANPADAITKHCKGVAKRYPLSTPGGTQELRIISEPDMLRLIVGSKLPAAERFERWVFEEVLPSIRKTGRYEVPPPDLGMTPRLPQPADRIAAASRIFNQLVRSGNVARMALPAAIRRAAAVALRETGVDMVAELGIAAHVEAMESLALSGRGWNGDEPASPGYASVVRFWEGWADGSLGLRKALAPQRV
jgi:prophage antirepressor-like protein